MNYLPQRWPGCLLLGLSALFILLSGRVDAQCNAGEVEVFVEVLTDGFGYETYWELGPTGFACGDSTSIFQGGNGFVGCLGGGAQQQNPGGYPGNSVISEGPFCLTEGADYDIILVDDWGDDAAGFNVKIGNVVIASFPAPPNNGPISNASYTFTASTAGNPDFDADLFVASYPGSDEYLFVPDCQVKAMELGCKVRNAGLNDLSGISVSLRVLEGGAGGTPVYSSSDTYAGTLSAGDTIMLSDFGTYTPANLTTYVAEYVVSVNESDQVVLNDAIRTALTLTGAVYARDDGLPIGGLGTATFSGFIEMGQSFDFCQPVQIDSVEFLIGADSMAGSPGDTLQLRVYEGGADTPGVMIAASDWIVHDGSVTSIFASLTAPLIANIGDSYIFTLYHQPTGISISLNYSDIKYSPGTTWINADFDDGNGPIGWTHGEELGFPVAFVVRPYVACLTPCDIPVNLMSVANGGDFTLSWDPVATATAYNYRYRALGDSVWMSGSTATNSVLVNGLDDCTMYEFQAEANCSGVWSTYSASATFVSQNCPTECLSPTGLTATSVGVNTIDISWIPNFAAVGYRIKVKRTGIAGSAVFYTFSDNASNSFQIPDLLAGTMHNILILSYCGPGGD